MSQFYYKYVAKLRMDLMTFKVVIDQLIHHPDLSVDDKIEKVESLQKSLAGIKQSLLFYKNTGERK